MANQKTSEDTPAPAPILAKYEVECHSIEIGDLLCYRTHRLVLSQADAEAINKLQPGSLRFVGI